MQKSTWKLKITKACKDAGTYQPCFNHVIDTLAEILEKRDYAMWCFEVDDDETMVIETSRNGKIKNPLIATWEDMNKLALQYWKELGLTPVQLRKINEETFTKTKEEKNGNSLMELLRMKQQAAGKG